MKAISAKYYRDVINSTIALTLSARLVSTGKPPPNGSEWAVRQMQAVMQRDQLIWDVRGYGEAVREGRVVDLESNSNIKTGEEFLRPAVPVLAANMAFDAIDETGLVDLGQFAHYMDGFSATPRAGEAAADEIDEAFTTRALTQLYAATADRFNRGETRVPWHTVVPHLRAEKLGADDNASAARPNTGSLLVIIDPKRTGGRTNVRDVHGLMLSSLAAGDPKVLGLEFGRTIGFAKPKLIADADAFAGEAPVTRILAADPTRKFLV